MPTAWPKRTLRVLTLAISILFIIAYLSAGRVFEYADMFDVKRTLLNVFLLLFVVTSLAKGKFLRSVEASMAAMIAAVFLFESSFGVLKYAQDLSCGGSNCQNFLIESLVYAVLCILFFFYSVSWRLD